MLFSNAASKKIAVMQLLTNCSENPYKTPVKKFIPSKVEVAVVNLLKVNSFTGMFYRFSAQGEETVTGKQLQNSLLLMIYIRRSLLTRRLFLETVFKATIFCSVALIMFLFCSVALIMFLFCYKDTSLNLFYIQRMLN